MNKETDVSDLEEVARNGPHGEGPVGILVPDAGTQGEQHASGGLQDGNRRSRARVESDARRAAGAPRTTEPPMSFPDPDTASGGGHGSDTPTMARRRQQI